LCQSSWAGFESTEKCCAMMRGKIPSTASLDGDASQCCQGLAIIAFSPA
jgi:hypothetical protein